VGVDSSGVLKTKTVLFAEDDHIVREEVADILKFYFKTVLVAEGGKEAYRLFLNNSVDVLLTDVIMDDMDGLELVSDIRKSSPNIPIIVITAHTSEELLLRAITLKLTGYIKKPHSLSRIKNALRLCEKEFMQSVESVTMIDVDTYFDTKNALIVRNGKDLFLTQKESRLLSLLLKNKNNLVSKEELLAYVWQGEYASEDALKNLLLRLRKKIGSESITSLKGFGYRLCIAESI